ncbi:ABC transporter permease [Segnochrobactrum spirostomi]|uniref:ABC transporter permease n=1 Tax=Segnochrobactrum spirostomi TaxID=2608987 RepID=A0A6A7Y3B1_9HYPH|nr:ABC transporter permease [Segnochrobactrum spirostomi]MQT13563.1 ABC transporter permease [Segnochrobactrum spirostomi]
MASVPLLRRAGNVVAFGYLTLGYVFIFLPVAVLILFSFQDGALPVPPFKGPTLVWYERLFANDRLMDGLFNSLIVGLGSSALSVMLGFLAAYGLARYEFRGRSALQAIILLPLAVSYLLVGMGLLVGLSAFGLGPSLPMVVVGHVVINMPLAFAICLGQLGEHQRKIEWAARDLGASTFRILTTITVPMIAPALIAAFCLCFTLSWDEFLIAYLVTRFDVTLPVVIWSMLRGGLNPQTNAVGSLIFVCSIVLVAAVEALLFGKRRR